MNAPSLRVQYPFDDDDQQQARVPIKWVDIFEGRAEENKEKDARPWLKSTQRSNKITVFDQCEQKASQKIQKTVGSSFIIKHSYAYHLRNIETGETVAWYQNLKSPWFDNMAEAKNGWKRKKKNATRVKTSITPTSNGLLRRLLWWK